MTRGAPRLPLEVRIERHIERVPLAGCWIWMATTTLDGYGKVGMTHAVGHYEIVPAHRASWIVHRGPIPAGMWVLHHCDVRCCVNPDHLYLGTVHDNNNDTLTRRGRLGAPNFGIRNGSAKLTPETANRIRSLYPAYTQAVLAVMFSVGSSTISRVLHGRAWVHP